MNVRINFQHQCHITMISGLNNEFFFMSENSLRFHVKITHIKSTCFQRSVAPQWVITCLKHPKEDMKT